MSDAPTGGRRVRLLPDLLSEVRLSPTVTRSVRLQPDPTDSGTGAAGIGTPSHPVRYFLAVFDAFGASALTAVATMELPSIR
jgi:hypothetical protein